jgi:phosphoglycolate phosphatase-like HAD superfamily hydrolase
LWKTGYEDGDLITPLFDDVIPTLEAWKNAGKTLAIFSSGSVQAQLQFFSFVKADSTTRDLKPLFTAHFDPTIAGSKLEKRSYEKICSELGQKGAQVTFLTDNVKGMYTSTSLDVVAIAPPFFLSLYSILRLRGSSTRPALGDSLRVYLKRLRSSTDPHRSNSLAQLLRLY